jgi:hypothetical protein
MVYWVYHDATKNAFPRNFEPKIWCLIKKGDCPKFHHWSNQNGELFPTKLGVRSSKLGFKQRTVWGLNGNSDKI